MQLSVYSLKRVLFEGGAKSLNVKAVHGELTILDHHRPLIAMLGDGPVRIVREDEREEQLSVRGGFVEVKPGSVVNVLVDE